MSKFKYELEIDVSHVTTDRYAPRWANYGTIVTHGNTLEECLENASVDVMDQDGGEIDVLEADAPWMHDEIVKKFWTEYGAMHG